MENRLTISIGISAYNEAANIKNHLLSIVNQREKGFKIREIIVVSDASTDSTADKIKEIKDRRISLIKRKERIGQNANYNYIFKLSKSDIVVLLEADTLLKSDDYLIELIKPFILDKQVGLVYGSTYPIAVGKSNFFDQMLTFVESHKETMLRTLNYNSLYFCGSGKAFKKNKFVNFSYPTNVPEDTYVYLYAKQNKLKFLRAEKACVLFKSPTNFMDYAKKTIRYNQGKKQLGNYFSAEFLAENYKLPKNWSKSFLFKGLRKNFIFMTAYIFFNFLSKIFLQFSGGFNPLWKPSKSTKILNK